LIVALLERSGRWMFLFRSVSDFTRLLNSSLHLTSPFKCNRIIAEMLNKSGPHVPVSLAMYTSSWQISKILAVEMSK
jgi:hypothetical protein